LLPLCCLCLLAGTPVASLAPQSVGNSAPTVASFTPTSAVAGSPAITIAISGNNFVEGATVTFSGQPLTILQFGGSQIIASVPASSLVQVGLRQVSVTNPPPGGGTGTALMPFQVVPPPTPPQ
jgi:trimeric autotransporter adhesin